MTTELNTRPENSGEAQLMAAILDWQRNLRKELEAENLATEHPPAGSDRNYMAKLVVAQAVGLQPEPSPKEDEQAEAAPGLEAEPLLVSSMAQPAPELEEADVPPASPPPHQLGNKVEAAYRRGDLLAKRQQLMQDWADYALGHRTGNMTGGHSSDPLASTRDNTPDQHNNTEGAMQ